MSAAPAEPPLLRPPEFGGLVALRSRWGWAAVLLAIALWQGGIYLGADTLSDEHRRRDASGFSHELAQKFYYFYHHLDLFPVAAWGEQPLEQSQEGARRFVRESGDALVNEWGYWSRLGESGRIFAYLPHGWLQSSAAAPSIRPFNVLVLAATLALIWTALWAARLELLGLGLVLVVGSSPTLLYEVYRNDNIFALQPLLGLALLALHAPLLRDGARWPHLAIAAASGLLVGAAYHFRAETLALAAAPALAYLLLLPKTPWRLRGALVAALLVGTIASLGGIEAYFGAKRAEAKQFVAEAGGVPYEGFSQKTHGFWHPVFCGLGDFGGHLGYAWSDLVAYAYALPLLEERYGKSIRYPNTDFPITWRRRLLTDEFYDAGRRYPVKLEDLPEYNAIVRDKVLSDIVADPLWYVGVLLRRSWRALAHTSPVALRLGRSELLPPFSGALLLPYLLVMWRLRRRFEAVLALFLLPIGANAILIYSGSNATYSGAFHFVLAALLLVGAVDLLRARLRRRVAMPR